MLLLFNSYALARQGVYCPVAKALREPNKDERSGHEKASDPTLFI